MDFAQLCNARDSIFEKTGGFAPQVAVVLGSGLGGFVDSIKEEFSVPYSEISGLAISTVAGHNGRFVFGTVEGVAVVVMQGRVHFYEGYDMAKVVAPVRIMAMLGAKKLIVTNSAGGINTDFSAGSIMAITDHILMAQNPLLGANIDELGERFSDMTYCYNKKYVQIVLDNMAKLGIKPAKGVYLQVSGPSYETPAEICAYRAWGADAVGMSTACEVIVARHIGMEVCGISAITNMAAGVIDKKLNHTEVLEVSLAIKTKFEALIRAIIVPINQG